MRNNEYNNTRIIIIVYTECSQHDNMYGITRNILKLLNI